MLILTFLTPFDFNILEYRMFYLLFADWNRDGTWDHSMIITDWDWINGHWEPRLSYHSDNKDNIPFSQVKSAYNYKFKGLHILAPVW